MFEDYLAVKNALLHSFPRLNVLVVGDVMLDKYLWGDVTRVSQEAPVPVVHLQRRSASLGGAAYVAGNLAALGLGVNLAGFLGKDQDAELVREECQRSKIGSDALISVSDYCTVTKTRVYAGERQLLRVDEEFTALRCDEDADKLLAAIDLALANAKPDAVILSDYAKGACSPYLCQQLIRRCRTLQIPVYVDPKGRDYAKYAGATAIKPNRPEINDIALAMGWNTHSPIESARRLREYLDLDFVAVTLGAQGIALVTEDEAHEIPTEAREVFDVSGAGDAVIAALVAALAAKVSLFDSIVFANLAAAEVVARVGSVCVDRQELLVALQETGRGTDQRKLYSLEDLKTLVSAWRARGLKVAFTNGCFDLLHAGHIRLLEDSAAQTDRLIVGINSDASVTRLKGPDRPIMPEAQRATVLSALECIDAVVVFEEDTPMRVIQEIRPTLLIKGGDYTKETVVGAEFVESYGGSVALIPLVKGVSTTLLAEAITKL